MTSDLAAVISMIPWASISEVKGSCERIPSAINSLVSDDPEMRRRAYWQIDNHVVVQGGLFEGAFYVIPFLAQICISNSENGKLEALDLLIEIASGACRFAERVEFEIVKEPFLYFVPEKGGVDVPLPVACRFAIGSRIDSLKQCIVSGDSNVRTKAAELLMSFPEFAHEFLKYLEELSVEQQLDEAVLADIKKVLYQIRSLL